MSTHDGGADGPADPLPLPDDFDDVLPLLGMSDLDWPGVVGDYYTGDGGGAPGVCTQPNGLPVHGEPSTSSSTTAARLQADVLDCSGCQVLREVVHSNGLELTKLCIHGAAGLFYHATSEVYIIGSEGLAPALADQSCIDFRGRDYESVRNYLTKYALQQAAGNHAVVRDSLSMFHHVLCTPMNPGSTQGNETHDHEANGANRRGIPVHHAAVVQPGAVRRNKEPEQPAGPSQPNHTTHVQVQQQPLQQLRSTLAMQREKTRNMQFSDIAPYFHLRIIEAAEKLDIRTTALKGICRRVGVHRWPHRKLKKLDKQIAELRRSGNGASERDAIERLNADRKRIIHGPE